MNLALEQAGKVTCSESPNIEGILNRTLRIPPLLLASGLVLFGPLDLIVGLLHGQYPTEATIISVASFLVGLFLWRYNLRQGTLAKKEPASTEASSSETRLYMRLRPVSTSHLVQAYSFSVWL